MSKTKVLIVEDEQIIAMALEETLISLGYYVVGRAASGEQSLELVQDNSPDLVLMDIMLGDGVDGIQTAEIIDQNFKIPVIFLTALSDESTLQNIKSVNPFGYLIKPCDDRELVAAIEVALARQSKELAIATALKKEQALREMKAKFMSMLSHEFSNTLNVISMAQQMLVANYKEPDKSLLNMVGAESDCINLHQTLAAGIKQMNRLIQEAAQITKEEFYGFRFLPQPCNLVQFCEALVADLNMQYQASHQVKLMIDSSIMHLQQQGSLFLDHNLLHHILTNIISNAVKYSPIKRETTEGNQAETNSFYNRNRVDFYVTYEVNEIVFRIQDYGIGIPPEMLSNLFQPFYRGYNVGKIPGTGLGLALVKQCVDLHQGKIKVDSELNYGSTFTIWFPVTQNPSYIITNMMDIN